MLAYDVRYPSTIGTVVRGLRTHLTAAEWVGVTVLPELPDAKTARVVTVRDDGGTARSGVMRRRHGVNVWADDPVDAENLAIETAVGMGRLGFLDVSDPVEVPDATDEVLTVGGKRLTHYYITGVLPVRARNA